MKKSRRNTVAVERPRSPAELSALHEQRNAGRDEIRAETAPWDYTDRSAPTIRRMTTDEQTTYSRREPLTRPYVRP